MKLFLTVFFVCFLGDSMAQNENNATSGNVEGLKIAFLTRQLSLTIEEAQKFWPVYYSYSDEQKAIKKMHFDNILQQEEKDLNLKKKYFNDFKRILGSDERANKVFLSEREFANEIKKILQNRQQNKGIKPNVANKFLQPAVYKTCD